MLARHRLVEIGLRRADEALEAGEEVREAAVRQRDRPLLLKELRVQLGRRRRLGVAELLEALPEKKKY